MQMIFATWAFAEYQGRIMTEEGAKSRLVSYWEIMDKGNWVLPEYVEYGSIEKPKARRK
jgi:hypothetical protein